jgi:tripartite-type tricarboxylate transporter receptor subunit TctC
VLQAVVMMVAAVLACLSGGAGQAQEAPVRLVRIVVPFAPGGSSDPLAGMLAAELTTAFGLRVQ